MVDRAASASLSSNGTGNADDVAAANANPVASNASASALVHNLCASVRDLSEADLRVFCLPLSVICRTQISLPFWLPPIELSRPRWRIVPLQQAFPPMVLETLMMMMLLMIMTMEVLAMRIVLALASEDTTWYKKVWTGTTTTTSASVLRKQGLSRPSFIHSTVL